MGIFRKSITLTEMVMVIAIAGMLSGVALMSFAYLPKRRLQGDVYRVMTDLWRIRDMAMATHDDYCIRFASKRYQVYQGACGGANLLRTETLTVTVDTPNPPFDLTFYSFTNSPTGIGGTAFSADSINNELLITLEQIGLQKSLRVFEGTGYVRME